MKYSKIISAATGVILLLPLTIYPCSMTYSESTVKGDVDRDGSFTASDVVLLEKWLLNSADVELVNWESADFCEDNRLDVFDLCLMKKALAESGGHLKYTAKTDQFFVGYTNQVMKNTSPAVIDSADKLQKYLAVYFDNQIIQNYMKIYSSGYFKENVLLLNTVCQSRGGKSLISVNDVSFFDEAIHVSAERKIPEVAEDVTSAVLMQVQIPRDTYNDRHVLWDISDIYEIPDTPADQKLIEVKNILQNPELPTGCECTALTILLNHLGFEVDKLTMARNYLPKLDFYWEDGIYYGADFRTTFAGDPESEYSYGCYAPCIKTTADNYFKDNGYDNTAVNISGLDFDKLLTDYIDNDMPVLIWITSGDLHETMLTSVWTTPTGAQVQWLAYEHCVVLTGYNKSENLIYVSDPLYGNKSYDYTKLKQRYVDLGQQAVYIK